MVVCEVRVRVHTCSWESQQISHLDSPAVQLYNLLQSTLRAFRSCRAFMSYDRTMYDGLVCIPIPVVQLPVALHLGFGKDFFAEHVRFQKTVSLH